MSCPFAAAAAAAPEGHHSALGDASKCPMHAMILEAQRQQQQGQQQQGQQQQEKQQQQHDLAPPAPAVCPLGFGSARGPSLSKLHCPLCRALLFDAHKTACGHVFCHACISQATDCPICGRDVAAGELEPEPELAGLVDTFLDTHSKSPQLVAAQADLGPLPDDSAASFFMAQGLKSLAGGNVRAALHRLGRCREELLAAAAGGGGGGEQQRAPDEQRRRPAAAGAAAACQLAAVCGSLGDCHQRLGDAALAEQRYQESAAAVAPHAEADAEAAHALSVTLSKLGDARYVQQRLAEAGELYRRALQLRELRCGPLAGGRPGTAELLELATSLVKVADVGRALGEGQEADAMMRRAQGLCCEVACDAEKLSPAVQRKLQMLLDVLGDGRGAAAAAAPADAAADV